jgi:isoleucyl-tRNA synthetase
MPDDSSPSLTEPRDYRATVFLPQTPFPMRAGLPKLEPEILARWDAIDLYRAVRRRRQAENAPLYVLHDGPPYANGAIHIGHALNKTLKDFVVRSRFVLGYDVDYVPGWDCHGLPIEWKVEEKFRASGRRKDEISKAEFRTACRTYAAQWIEAQKAEFKRLGVLGRWDAPYLTMDYSAEAATVAEFHKFVMAEQVYRGSKPVMWSPVERTALADAEVEYHPHVSPTVYVRFPVRLYEEDRFAYSGDARGENVFRLAPNDASVVIWTTTPWTIPANRAIAFNPDIAYGLFEVEAMAQDLEFAPWAKPGDRLIVADKLADTVREAAHIAAWRRIASVDPDGLVCAHPLARLDAGYDFDVPLLAGDHVTEEAGTGFVHTAPGHGVEDYQLWIASGRREIPDVVDPDGAYYPSVPLFGGLKVLETEGKKAGKFGPANSAVMDRLIEAGALLARGRVEHSYPHSWRSKAPVLFRNTPQWFIRMDAPLADGRTLRETALAEIDRTAFYPASGRNRIRGMVAGRPDWLVSRQRAWGTPLAIFVDKATGAPLRDAAVNARIVDAVRRSGADAWFTADPAEFLGPDHDPQAYEAVQDILDVWFDSGSSHAFTLETPRAPDDPSHTPADLYLEGTDQARGWFQSSLLESCGTRGRAPYLGVLTHGFTMAESGEKMSKSLGNTVEPDAVIRQSGAEILRLWVAVVDAAEDQRIGPAILQTTADAYRRLRNTLRYLLGALEGFTEAERVKKEDMPPLERYMLHRLNALDHEVREAYEGYRFSEVLRPVLEFCGGDLSAFYFDIRKDSLYCDGVDSSRRRAARTVMDLAFERLTAWLSPLAPFTTDEAYLTRWPGAGANALRRLPEPDASWRDDGAAARWLVVKEALETVNGALEAARRDKLIGAALEADVALAATPEVVAAFEGLDPAEVFRTSAARFVEGALTVAVDRAEGAKCERCWRVLPEVTMPRALCLRCADVLDRQVFAQKDLEQ